MKRTKRYGGFLVGDRVRVKTHPVLGEGKVEGYDNGYIKVYFSEYDSHWQCDDKEFAFMPNQLINLTRIDEEKVGKFLNKVINEGVFEIPLTEEEAKDIIAKKYFCDPLPSPYTRDVYTTTKDYE